MSAALSWPAAVPAGHARSRPEQSPTPRPGSWATPAGKALFHQEPQVGEAIAPRVELHFAQPGTVLDGDFAESDAWILERLDFDFLGKRHAVGFETDAFQNLAAENPDTRLRAAHPTQEENGDGHPEHTG